MADPRRAIVRAADAIELDRARKDIRWIPDHRLAALETREPSTAWALSFFFGGGGQLYVGDYAKGIGLLALVIASFAVLPQSVAWIGWLVTGLVGSTLATRQARATNRYLFARQQANALNGDPAVPAAYRLLAAKSAVDAAAMRDAVASGGIVAPSTPTVVGRHAELVEQLRKVALLHAQRALHEVEYKERKHDLLEAVPIPTRDALDDVLLELVPLREEGVITQDDLEYLKALGVRP